MSRTTIMAPDELLDELRAIARAEGLSLGEVIRQGLEWRARTRPRIPSFIAKVAAEPGPPGPEHDASLRVDELVGEHIRAKHARY